MNRVRYSTTAELLQWFGLFGAGLTWTVQLVVGFGVTVARCGAANAVLGVDFRAWEIALMVVGLALVCLSEAAALTVLWQTRGVEHSDAAPEGRRHFFAYAASLGNILFFMIILLSGIAVISHEPCRG
jgi:hypothetical protein